MRLNKEENFEEVSEEEEFDEDLESLDLDD